MDRYQKLLCEKAKKKRKFLGTMFFPRTPVILVDLSHSKESSEFADLLEGFRAINLTTLVIPPKKKSALPASDHLHVVRPEEKAAAFEAADFVMVLDGAVKEVWQYGCVPISQLDGDETIDYNALREKGNGFYFKNATKWEMFAAIVRALETYQFPYDWENLIREILSRKN